MPPRDRINTLIDQMIAPNTPRRSRIEDIRQDITDALRGITSGMTFGGADVLARNIDPAFGREFSASVQRSPVAVGGGAALLPIAGPAVGALRQGVLPFAQDVVGGLVRTLAAPARTAAAGTGTAVAEAAIRNPELVRLARQGDSDAIKVLGLTAAGGAIPGAAAGAIGATRRGGSALLNAIGRGARRRVRPRIEPRFTDSPIGPPTPGAQIRGTRVGTAAEPRMSRVGRPTQFKNAYQDLDRELDALTRGSGSSPESIRGTITAVGRRHGIPPGELAEMYGRRLALTRGPLKRNIPTRRR